MSKVQYFDKMLLNSNNCRVTMKSTLRREDKVSGRSSDKIVVMFLFCSQSYAYIYIICDAGVTFLSFSFEWLRKLKSELIDTININDYNESITNKYYENVRNKYYHNTMRKEKR